MLRKFPLFRSEWKNRTTFVYVKIFDSKLKCISFLTCESTETGAVTQRFNKSQLR